jgi:NADH-quinone oxidoreductase subunit J
MAALLLFIVLAVAALTGGLGMLLSRNPVNSALWLILNMFSIAGLYLTLNAQFIGVIQVLVYAGAIMVLFLFVIMLLNLAELPGLEDIDWKRIVAFGLGIIVLAQLVYAVAVGLEVVPEPLTPLEAAANASVEMIALELFTRYALAIQIIGILLLVATIGAVMLAKRRFA